MQIRDFRTADAARLGEIFHLAVQATPDAEYSAAQRNVWSAAPIPAERYLARVTAGAHRIFVAVDAQDDPQGFIELQPDGHIDCFYRAPSYRASGLGQQLYDHLEVQARSAGMSRLYVEASDAAQRFFLRQGFAALRLRRFDRLGVEMHHMLMEKHLL